jgi:ATP-dependent DNA ligase
MLNLLSFAFPLPEPGFLLEFDGYCLRVERNGDRVRLITRRGYDWTKRFPGSLKLR